MKIERSRTVVSLYKGHYQVELDDLLERASAALRAEVVAGPARVGQGPLESMRLGREYDELLAMAESDAHKVTLFALPFDLTRKLTAAHPPREDNEDDKSRGVNMDTYMDALLKAAIVPEDQVSVGSDLDKTLARGEQILAEMSPTAPQVQKLSIAAYNINNGDDALPKFSLVSKLMEMKEPGSRAPSEPESAPGDSQATSQPKRTGS